MKKLQKISPFLWFDNQAEEAAMFYVSIFKNSKITHIQKYAKSAVAVTGKPENNVMTVAFELENIQYTALNGGPVKGFTFTPAISFVINCETQEEIDYFWSKLSARPEFEQCGWCVDKFGVTWQIVPDILTNYLSSTDPVAVERVTMAFMKMKKFNIKELKKAYDKSE